MKITNHEGLPDAIVQAVMNDPYSRGDGTTISVTELIAPPRIVALRNKHRDEIEEDASDRIWSLVGQAVHNVLERANKKGIAERRLSIDILGHRLSGAMDLYYEEGILFDYKIQSVWRFLSGVPKEIEEQLNCYAEILRQNGERVTEIRVIAILRDWSKMRAMQGGNYPHKQVLNLSTPLWPESEARSFIQGRLKMHDLAKTLLPDCTDHDRWASNEYAVMKTGRKSAIKLLGEDLTGARSLASTLGPDHYVEHRQEPTRRCGYCNVQKFCEQFKKLPESKKEILI